MLWHPDVRGWSAKAGEIVTALFWRLIWAQIDFFPRIHLAWITYILRNLYSQVFKKKKKKLQKFNTIMKMATKMVSKWSIKIRLKKLKTEANYVLFPFHFQLALIWSFILFSPGPNLNALMPQPYKNAPSQSNLNFLSECWVFFKEMLCCPFVTGSASWRWIIRMLLSPILKETHSAIMSAWCRVLCVLL